jgi:hypothetical protein
MPICWISCRFPSEVTDANQHKIGARAVVRVDQADLGDTIEQGQILADGSQPNHVPRIGHIGTLPSARLLSRRRLKTRLEQCMEHLRGVDESIGRLGARRGVARERRRRAIAQVLDRQGAAKRVAVGGEGGFGDMESVHGRFPS